MPLHKQDVQLLFDIELRGPLGAASNLLPWTAAKEAIVVQVLCRGYLPAADPADVTVEVLNAFTVRPACVCRKSRVHALADACGLPVNLAWLGCIARACVVGLIY